MDLFLYFLVSLLALSRGVSGGAGGGLAPCCHSECCCSTCPLSTCSRNPSDGNVVIPCSCENAIGYTCSRTNTNSYQLPQLPPPMSANQYQQLPNNQYQVSNNGINLASYPVISRPLGYPQIGAGAFPLLPMPAYTNPCPCGMQQPVNCLQKLPCNQQTHRIDVIVKNDQDYWGRHRRHWYDWDFGFLETPQGIALIIACIILILLILCLIGGLIAACIRSRSSSSSNKRREECIIIDEQNSYQQQQSRGQQQKRY